MGDWGAGTVRPTIVGNTVSIYHNSGWTQHGTYTNVYYRTLSYKSSHIATQQSDNSFKPLTATHCSDGDTCSDIDTYLAIVNNTPGSVLRRNVGGEIWTLYIHTAASVNPNSDGIKYYNLHADNQVLPITVSGSEHITIQNIQTSLAHQGIALDSANGPANVTIDSCAISGCSEGCALSGSAITFINSEIKHCGDGMGGGGENLTITSNTFTSGRDDINDDNEGIGLHHPNDLTIQYNTITDYRNGVWLQAESEGVTNLHISNNYFKATSSAADKKAVGIHLGQGSASYDGTLLIHDNILELYSHSGAQMSIQLTADTLFEPDNDAILKIFNNTISAEFGLRGGTSSSDEDDISGMQLRNNVFVSTTSNIYAGDIDVASGDLDYNLYVAECGWTLNGSSWSTLSAYSLATGFDDNGLTCTMVFCVAPAWQPTLTTSCGTNDGKSHSGLLDIKIFTVERTPTLLHGAPQRNGSALLTHSWRGLHCVLAH